MSELATQELIKMSMIQTQTLEKVVKLEKKVDYLENTQPVNPSVTLTLETKRKRRVMHWLGGKESQAYKEISRQVFAEAGRDFKVKFNINRFDMLQRKDEITALLYWDHWEPSTNTKLEIQQLNNQMTLIS